MKTLFKGLAALVVCLCLSAVALGEGVATQPTATQSTATQPGEAQPTATQQTIAQVTTEQGPLNLRKSMDAHSGILEKIPNRSLVTVLSQQGEMWEISYNGTQGYAVSTFLTLTDYTSDVLAYRVLYRSNTGDDVIALKNRLLALGYYRVGSTMNNVYNDTCVERVKMFQRENNLKEDGIATPVLQAALFADAAVANTEPLPKPKTSGYVVASSDSSASSSGDIDWNQWMLDHPGVCPCCMVLLTPN